MTQSTRELRLVALTGNLGYGFRLTSLKNGMDVSPHLLGADNGSTDPGPYYLGSGEQLTKPLLVRRDLEAALAASLSASIPLVIGSAGTAGGDPHLAAVLDLLSTIARERDLHFSAARIHAEIPKEIVSLALADGRIEPLPGVCPLDGATLNATTRIVGQMGVDPFITALESGVDVIIAGRSCDTAIYAALPIKEGYHRGLAYHMAKIMECGAQSAIPLAPNDSLLGVIRDDHFLITPLDRDRTITTQSVAAHTLYEQNDPTRIVEPDGHVDLTTATFEQVDPRTVRVSGSGWVPAPVPSVKLEGVRFRGYRTVAIAGIVDPLVIRNLDLIESTARDAVASNLAGVRSVEDYQLRLRHYGRDAVLGLGATGNGEAHDMAVVIEAQAATQDDADAVLALFRSSLLHCPFPGRKATAGNLAFPYSPSDVRLGPAYEFSIYHRLLGSESGDLFKIEYTDF